MSHFSRKGVLLFVIALLSTICFSLLVSPSSSSSSSHATTLSISSPSRSPATSPSTHNDLTLQQELKVSTSEKNLDSKSDSFCPFMFKKSTTDAQEKVCTFPCTTENNKFVEILPDFPCFDGCRCPPAKCILVNQSCLLSPHYVAPSSTDFAKQQTIGNELICEGLEKGDEIPPAIPLAKIPTFADSVNGGIESARLELQRFKRATSWMFSKWFDWGENIPYGGNNPQRVKRRNEIEKIKSKYNNNIMLATPRPKFVKPLNGGAMEGKHVHAQKYSGLFVWTNVCFQSEGPPMGYKPQVANFKGRSEAEIVGTKVLMQAMTVFVVSPKKLSEPPKLVLDMNVLVIGIDWKADNPGHVMYRAIAARRIGEYLWGNGGGTLRNNNNNNNASFDVEINLNEGSELHKEEFGTRAPSPFHVIYVIVIDNSTDEKDVEGHRYFYQLVGHSWSVVIAKSSTSLESRRAHIQRKYNNKDVPYSPDEMHNEILSAAKEKSSVPFTCFKEVVVYHACLIQCKFPVNKQPGNRFMFPYLIRHETIHEKVIRRFRQVIMKCLSLNHNNNNDDDTEEEDRKVSNSPLQITLIARTQSRVDYGLASAVPQIDDQIRNFLSLNGSSPSWSNYSLNVISQHEHTPNSFFKMLLSTDILIGSMGASLSFGSWMLRHKKIQFFESSSSSSSTTSAGILVEIVGTSACTAHKIGWEQSLKCDFGANAKSAGNRHFVIQLPKGKSVPTHLYPTPGIYAGGEVLSKLTRIALCKKFGDSAQKGCRELNLGEWSFATWKIGVDS